jgi:cobalt/nickel transport system permease protein
MAFYGCFVGYYLIWRPIIRSGLFSKLGEKAAVRARIILASVLGCTVTLELGAFSVVLETTLSGITELPFGAFCALMLPIHLPSALWRAWSRPLS